MNFKILTIVVIAIMLFNSCNSKAKNETQNNSECRNTTNTKEEKVKLEVDLDSVFYYYNKVKQLPEGTQAYKIIEVLDNSKLGSLDNDASGIKNSFSNEKLKAISPVLLYYVSTTLLDCQQTYERYFDEEFDNMPESAQRATVQSEMNSRENKLKKAKNILEAVLSVELEDKSQALLLYGNVLYNLDEDKNAEKAYSEYFNIMKEKGKIDEVPGYVTNPDERKEIGEE